MKCIYQIPGNIVCRQCNIKRNLIKDRCGAVHLSEEDATKLGLSVETRLGDSWLSIPNSKMVTCGREIKIPVH